MIATIDYLILA